MSSHLVGVSWTSQCSAEFYKNAQQIWRHLTRPTVSPHNLSNISGLQSSKVCKRFGQHWYCMLKKRCICLTTSDRAEKNVNLQVDYQVAYFFCSGEHIYGCQKSRLNEQKNPQTWHCFVPPRYKKMPQSVTSSDFQCKVRLHLTIC